LQQSGLGSASQSKKRMRNSEIKINIALDEQNIPDTITWQASDAGNEKQETKAFLLGVWDDKERNMMNINLWNKHMEVPEMKLFAIQLIGGIHDLLLRATGDEQMAEVLATANHKLVDMFMEEFKPIMEGGDTPEGK